MKSKKRRFVKQILKNRDLKWKVVVKVFKFLEIHNYVNESLISNQFMFKHICIQSTYYSIVRWINE